MTLWLKCILSMVLKSAIRPMEMTLQPDLLCMGTHPLAIDPAGPYTRTYRASAFLPGWVTSDPSEITYTMVPTVANPISPCGSNS
jgi:hypothetical protein